jgi:hypothetical protein
MNLLFSCSPDAQDDIFSQPKQAVPQQYNAFLHANRSMPQADFSSTDLSRERHILNFTR